MLVPLAFATWAAAGAEAASLDPAGANAAGRNPTGWALFSPCDRNCAIAVFAGNLVEDPMQDVLLPYPDFPTTWDYDRDDNFVGGAVSRYAATFWRIDIEPELGAGRRIEQAVTEAWAGVFFRYRGFPWDDRVVTTFAVSTGANFAFDYSDWEIERTDAEDGFKLMHYFAPEITFAAPGNPDLELLFRFHHRSGAFGVFNRVGGGAQYGTVGLRLRF
jgi:hypothetical protein